jgi:hypothetical protein
VTLSSSLHDIDITRTRSQSIDGRLMIYVEPTNRSRTHLFLKRTSTWSWLAWRCC